ncbi:MAG: effector binding domain-containing protein [Chloroflexia bacterium]|nr:effector binding domain-containing protein [Chloroflexia bacterium]
MSALDVRMVELEPMRVASFWGFGPNPEEKAWEKLLAWARPRGLLDDPGQHRLFGFNNPNPSKGSPNYGYEVWIELDAGAEPEGAERILGFDGGLYAVTRCVVPKGDFEVIGATWKKLVAWREDSQYRCGTHQWLEESVPLDLPDTEFVLDLYLPIAE